MWRCEEGCERNKRTHLTEGNVDNAANKDACCNSKHSEAIPTSGHYTHKRKKIYEPNDQKQNIYILASIALCLIISPYTSSQTTTPNPPSAKTLINTHGTPTSDASTHSFPA
jgi:hypothetical protein